MHRTIHINPQCKRTISLILVMFIALLPIVAFAGACHESAIHENAHAHEHEHGVSFYDASDYSLSAESDSHDALAQYDADTADDKRQASVGHDCVSYPSLLTSMELDVDGLKNESPPSMTSQNLPLSLTKHKKPPRLS